MQVSQGLGEQTESTDFSLQVNTPSHSHTLVTASWKKDFQTVQTNFTITGAYAKSFVCQGYMHGQSLLDALTKYHKNYKITLF